MAKINIETLDSAREGAPPAGFVGGSGTWAYYDSTRDPLHLHLHRIEGGTSLKIGPIENDCVAYVWEGAVIAGGRRLDRGSSFAVEHGASLEVAGSDEASTLITFATRPAGDRAGGHVHLLPSDRVPWVNGNSLAQVKGGLHFDSTCATCGFWLHENAMPARPAPLTREQIERGVHSHAEDEIIFVVDGNIRLGERLYDKGTALAIAANTFYGFAPGPGGLSFLTFRPSRDTGQIFKSGITKAEAGAEGYWAPAGSPKYLEPVG